MDMDTLTVNSLDAFYAGSRDGVLDVTPVGADHTVTDVPAHTAAIAAVVMEHTAVITLPPAFGRITDSAGVTPKTPRPQNS